MSTTPNPRIAQNDSRADEHSITSVLQTYIEGGRTGDTALMRNAFHPNATIHGALGGDLIAGPIEILFEWVANNPPASKLDGAIVSIDVVHTIATARVELTNWLGYRFTDQFTLFKDGETWTITSKVFHTH